MVYCNVLDRGLQYGDGVFETIAILEGKMPLWKYHLARLKSACDRLKIDTSVLENLTEELEAELVERQQLPRAIVKIIVTRGVGGRGYRPPVVQHSNKFILHHSWPDYKPAFYTQGISLFSCKTRLGMNPDLAGIKHLNRLEQVMARNEWDDEDIPEGLMCDTSGHVVEGTMSNVFIVEKGVLITPSVENCGVAGVMRQYIMDVSQSKKIALKIETISTDRLLSADEVFVCNSVLGIWPVIRLQTHQFLIGPITLELMRSPLIQERC